LYFSTNIVTIQIWYVQALPVLFSLLIWSSLRKYKITKLIVNVQLRVWWIRPPNFLWLRLLFCRVTRLRLKSAGIFFFSFGSLYSAKQECLQRERASKATSRSWEEIKPKKKGRISIEQIIQIFTEFMQLKEDE
jgi:hypothetical protein